MNKNKEEKRKTMVLLVDLIETIKELEKKIDFLIEKKPTVSTTPKTKAKTTSSTTIKKEIEKK